MDELTLIDYLAILRQQKTTFIVVFCFLFSLAVGVVIFWSNYRSMATIEILQPQVAAEITTPMGMNPNDMPEALADLRINRLREKVTSPSSLIDIITKFELYPELRVSEPMASLAEKMGKKITLKFISSEIANPAATSKISANELSAIAFTLSFDYPNPQTAQKVLNEVVTRFLDEDLKDRRSQAKVSSDFIQGQIETLEATMVEQEKKISTFEQQHGVVRPETLMFNQQAAANVAMNLQALDSQIASNEGTQGSIRSQLATVDPYSRVIADGQVLTTPAIQLKALQAQYATLTSQYGKEHPDVVKLKHQIEALKAENSSNSGDVDTSDLRTQIADVKTNLAAAKKNYGPDHPDVVSLKQQLKSLEDQLADAKKNQASGASRLKHDADNPAYLGFLAQLKAAEEQHKTLLEQRQKLSDQMEKYQQAVLANPALQQQMASLSRDYDNAQLRYRELKSKKMATDMDMKMIEDRSGERLAVISPPQLPLHTHPQGILILLAGFMVACLGGLTAVAARQMLNQAIFGARQLTMIIGVPPLITIPHIVTDAEETRSRGIFGVWGGRRQLPPPSMASSE
jgi:uncharacterized protein involved in exopolysaccharide biosynthesis